MNDALFTEAEVYDGDPLHPEHGEDAVPTPVEVVYALTSEQRAYRVGWLSAQAARIIEEALAAHLNGRELVASAVLFSGGNDSTVLAHLMRTLGIATHAVHANTTIGIEQTREFVRETCAGWELPLIERRPPDDYRAIVLGQVTNRDGSSVWAGGFPGPGAHWICYQRLKERALDLVRHDLGIANSRTKCALYIAGRRRQESDRREDVPLYEPDGSVIWCSPLAMWTSADLNTYRALHPACPQNPVSALIHMSGECLCGAFAHPGELDEIGYWFPEIRAEIEALQAEVRAAGFREPLGTWGHGQGVPSRRGRLCSSCVAAPALFEVPA